jgi:hypothetical protein
VQPWLPRRRSAYPFQACLLPAAFHLLESRSLLCQPEEFDYRVAFQNLELLMYPLFISYLTLTNEVVK